MHLFSFLLAIFLSFCSQRSFAKEYLTLKQLKLSGTSQVEFKSYNDPSFGMYGLGTCKNNKLKKIFKDSKKGVHCVGLDLDGDYHMDTVVPKGKKGGKCALFIVKRDKAGSAKAVYVAHPDIFYCTEVSGWEGSGKKKHSATYKKQVSTGCPETKNDSIAYIMSGGESQIFEFDLANKRLLVHRCSFGVD